MRLVIVIFISIIFPGLKANMVDSGMLLKIPSNYAPPETEKLIFILGNWEVLETEYLNDSEIVRKGVASFTLMNRGHGYMERLFFVNKENNEHIVSFYAFGKFTNKWMLGTVSSTKESVEVFDGGFETESLVLNNAVRFNGGANVVLTKLSYVKVSDNHFVTHLEESTDYGKNWQKKQSRFYNKTKHNITGFAQYDQKGNPERIYEAKQFDFLVGKGTAKQKILLPNGNWVKFTSNTLGAFILNGKAIYEYNWFDVDKQNPDAATSIIRIYNRNMRRWESLFYINRTNSLLFFGGQKEGNKVILHNFETNSDSVFSKFVFYDIGTKQYKWFGERSTDSGKTFTRFWEIDVTL